MEAGFGGFSTQWKPVSHGVETGVRAVSGREFSRFF
jgi:hypothetical protein